MAKNDRLMATAWRFEVNKGNPTAARFKQEALIAEREIEARMLKSMDKGALESIKTHWNDKFLETNEHSRAKVQAKRHADDVKILRQANLMVRRDAIKDLYLREYNFYEAELRTKGLAIHRERI